ncbi:MULTISPECIES: hypothetical protein [Rhodobacterales]|nr:hypothetical protein [Loktanella sp. S4079]
MSLVLSVDSPLRRIGLGLVETDAKLCTADREQNGIIGVTLSS